jgi:5-methyltetrahydrofolate--homocysteine methyltransferase
MELMQQLYAAVIEGKAKEIEGLTRQALEAGKTAQEILDQGLIPAMDDVGAQMRTGEMFIPEVLLSARVMKASLNVLKPLFAEGGAKMLGRVLLGTVQGDLHDIGKNLVGMMLEGAGFEVLDLGVDVAPEAFAEAVKESKPDILGLSALLTTSMTKMKSTIDALARVGVRDQVKVMIGGAAVTAKYAGEIGADGYAPDCGSAAPLAKEFLRG